MKSKIKKNLEGDIEKSKVSPSGAGLKRENDSLDDFEHLDPEMSPLKDQMEFHRSESPSKLLSEIDKELSFNKTSESFTHIPSDSITATKNFLADLTKPQTEHIHPDIHSATFDIQKKLSPKQTPLDSELVTDVSIPADKNLPPNEFDVTKFLETETSKIKTYKQSDLGFIR